MPEPYSKNYLEIRTLKHLSLRLGIPLKELQKIAEKAESLYRFEKDPKKNGDFRELSKPHPRLKKVQRAIHKLLREVEVSDCAHRGIKNRSNLSNASKHCNQQWILNLDFKRFFPSISPLQVYKMFYKELRCSPEVSSLLTRLCTVRFQVPQGGPMSTDIANLVCRKTDRRIIGLANRFGLTYTRFVDDITFSGDHVPKTFQIKVKQIIGQSGYKLNPKKEDLLGRHQPQIVTGLSVNRKRPKVPKKVKRQWRMDKYLFEKYESEQLPRQLQDKRQQKINGRENYVGYINKVQTVTE